MKYIDPTGHAYCDYIDNNNAEDCAGGLENSQSTDVIWGTGNSSGNNNNNGNNGNGNRPSDTPSGPTNTPTSTPCPSVVMTSCYPSSTSTLYPTVTPTPTPTGCNPTIANCSFPTNTPFLQEYVPVIEDAVGIVNPLQVSYGPDVATLFWDTLLGASPILGIPASNLNQVITTVATTTVTAVTYVANGAVNAAIGVSNAIGNAVNNVGWAVGNAFNTGLGPTLLIPLYVPSNLSPYSGSS